MKLVPTAYLSSYLLSLLGNSIAAIALPLVLLQTTGSVLNAGALAAATVVPAVLVGLFMGAVIDRVNRRSASVVADLISAASLAALPLVDMVSGLTLSWFILFGVLGSFGDVPGMTAREALLPAVVRHSGVPAERLVGMRESIGAVATLIGPAAAGGLLVAFGGSAVLWVTAATSAAAALITLLIPRRVGVVETPEDERAGQSSTWRQLGAGWRVLFVSNRFLLVSTVISVVMVAVISGMQGLVLPVHLLAIDEPQLLGFILSALAFGSLVGGIAYAVAGARASRRASLVLTLAATIVGFVTIGLLPATWLIFVGAGIVGVATGWAGSLLGVIMLERIPEHMRGRIMGTQNAIMTAAPALGIVAASLVTHYADVTAAGVGLAVCWSIMAVVAMLAPALRDLAPPPEAEPAGVGREHQGAQP